MKLKQLVSAAAIGLAGLTASTAAMADQVWNWSYSGPGVIASGTFTTAGMATVAEELLSITGTRNGVAITGLVPLDTDPDFFYDNLFVNSAEPFTDGGLLFSLAGSPNNVNLYYFEGLFTDLYDDGSGLVQTDLASFTATPVPEVSTALAMMAGLGLMGLYARKARAQG